MTKTKELADAIKRIGEICSLISIAESEPANARKDLKGAIVGHNNWSGHGLREIRGKELHSRAIEAVTDYLVNDLADRKRAELRVLAEELDDLRQSLPELANDARFELLDHVTRGRTGSGIKMEIDK